MNLLQIKVGNYSKTAIEKTKKIPLQSRITGCQMKIHTNIKCQQVKVFLQKRGLIRKSNF